jgi:hypothetical protein
MLQQLPEELLDRILWHVAAFPFVHDPQTHWYESENSWIPLQFRSTLLNICLASKTLYRLALPHLYKAFSNHAERGPPRATQPLHDLSSRYLRTLCAKPDYGNLLKSLSFNVADRPTATVPQVTSGDELADLALFSTMAHNFRFGTTWTARFQRQLPEGLLRKMPDATMCLVLLMCPNIETLEIVGLSEPGLETDPLQDSLLTFLLVVGTTSFVSSIAPDELLQRTLILQRVQSLTLATYPLRLAWSELMAVFSLPALRTLRMQYLCAIYACRPATRGIILGQLPCSELTSLELNCISVPGICVAELLKWCPKLTMLDATWGSIHDLDGPSYDCAFHEVGKAVSEYNPLLTSLKLIDSCLFRGAVVSRLCFTLRHRDLQHLTHVELGSESMWCHPSTHVDAFNDNLPDSIESVFVNEGDRLPDNLPIDGSPSDGDPRFGAACVAVPSSENVNDDLCQCRTRDIRRLLLDERLTRLRRVIFSEKPTAATEHGDILFHGNDPHVLRHIWTPAVRRRGWKMLERIIHVGHTTNTQAVLYRELTDGLEDVPAMSGC